MVIENALKPIDFCFEYVDVVKKMYNEKEYIMAYSVCRDANDYCRQKLYSHCRGYAKNIEKGKNPEFYTNKITEEIEEFNQHLQNFMIKIGVRKELLNDIHKDDIKAIHQKIVEDILINIGMEEDEETRNLILGYLDAVTTKVIERCTFDLNNEQDRIRFLNYIIGFTINRFANSMRYARRPKLVLHDYQPIDHILDIEETVKIFELKLNQEKKINEQYYDSERQFRITNSLKDVLEVVDKRIEELESLNEPIIHLPGFENGITTATKREFVKVVLSNFGFGTEECPYKKKPYSVIGRIKCDDPTYSSYLAFDNWYRRNRTKE